jgi:RNA polymerase sigma factor (sigma-70 family)
MNNFSDFLLESYNTTDKLTIEELNNYIEKTSKLLPSIVKDALYLIRRYIILDVNLINEILSASKSGLKNIAKKCNITESDMEELWKVLKNLKSNVKLLPHFQSPNERADFIKGKLTVDDMVVDLSTQQGRNDAAKMYMPLIHKIVNQYVGKSKLSRQELISAALVGFTQAMNQWDQTKGSTFKSYASYRVKQQILNDIDKLSHTMGKTNWYSREKYGTAMLDAVSIDGMIGMDDNGDFKQDRLSALGIDDKDMSIDRDEMKQMKQIQELIEKKFKQRDVDIFYRYFGLAGYKREKSKDIAKSYGMSEGNIRNAVINKIISYLRNDRNAMGIISNLRDLYNESLMLELIGCDADYIVEFLSNDDVYILLEELNRWENREVFNRTLEKSLENINNEKEIIYILKGDFEYLDSHLKKDKKLIVAFLNNMYPTENMSRKTDVSLLEYMSELQMYYQKYNR